MSVGPACIAQPSFSGTRGTAGAKPIVRLRAEVRQVPGTAARGQTDRWGHLAVALQPTSCRSVASSRGILPNLWSQCLP
jgi:hypothetical protein